MSGKIIVYIRSIFFCFSHLPFKQACKVPILIGKGVRYKKFKGTVIIKSEHLHRGMISLGLKQGTYYLSDYQSHLLGGGKIIFKGDSTICAGFRFYVSDEGELEIGKGTFMNANTTLSSNTIISIGDYCSFGWNCSLLDWDGHNILNKDGDIINHAKPIFLENCCWLSSHCAITKGVVLSHHTIVPYMSVVNKSNSIPYVIFGGQPNRILKTSIVREDFYNL